MKLAKFPAQEDLSYVPVFYSDRNVGVFKRLTGVIVEAYKNGFGKQVHYDEFSNHTIKEEGRGDTQHRVGELLSIKDHDYIIKDSYVGYDKFKQRIKEKFNI